MTTSHYALAVCLMVAACSPSGEEKPDPAEVERAIAMVKEMNTVPLVPLEPDVITQEDIELRNLGGQGCAFTVLGASEPILLTRKKYGWLKIDGEVVELTSDRSGERLPNNTWDKYIGLKHWLTLSDDVAWETADGEEAGGKAPSDLIIYDQYDQVVFRSGGSLACTA